MDGPPDSPTSPGAVPASTARPIDGRLYRFAPWIAAWRDGQRLTRRSLWPLFDLVCRLWLAQLVVSVGLATLTGTRGPVPAAWLAVELVGGVLLAVGAATRAAAAGLTALIAVASASVVDPSVQLYASVLLGWYWVSGAGPISVDAALGRGTRWIALPLVGSLQGAAAWLSRWGGPLALFAFRFGIAGLFFAEGVGKLANFDHAVALFREQYRLPLLAPPLAAGLAAAVELVCAPLLAAGLFTRVAAVPLVTMTIVIETLVRHEPVHAYWLALLVIPLLRGPGALSLDAWLGRRLAAHAPALIDGARWNDQGLAHVVIVSAGFAGAAAARALHHSPCRITLVDRHNYHLFQPLLYQVATAALSASEIAWPIREMFRDQANVRVRLGRVTGVDLDARTVRLRDERLGYDFLILATGARHSYFGRDEWETLAPGLKKIEDATEIRRRILVAFEHAEDTADPDERAAWLTFVVVGGGPTGVELAGAIAELAHHGLVDEFRHVDPAAARVILVQAGPRLLPALSPASSTETLRALEALGVEVVLGHRVQEVDAGGVRIGATRVAARTVVWAAGVIASPAQKWLGAAHDPAGRVMVAPDLTVPGQPSVFVVGDTAQILGRDGTPVPGIAPAAKQAGAYAAKEIHRRLLGQPAPPPFRYRHAGNLATIGRQAAVAEIGRVRLRGALAWWFWGLVHVLFLAGVRNRLVVLLNWAWAYLTFRRSTRLITDGPS